MEIEQLKALADHLLDFGIKTMQEGKELLPMYQLVCADGSREIFAIEGELMNSVTAKTQISNQVRSRARSGELQAVLFTSDTFTGQASEENQKVINALRLNVEQAHALGLCDKREAVIVVLDSPIYCQLLRQEYVRTTDGIQTTIRSVITPSDGKLYGRMFEYFDHHQAKHATT